MSRPHDDAQAWADELAYQLGHELALAVAEEAAKILKKQQEKPKKRES